MSRSLHTNRDLEKLEPYEGKPSCTVLRGEEGSNALDLPDRSHKHQLRLLFREHAPIVFISGIVHSQATDGQFAFERSRIGHGHEVEGRHAT